MKIKVTKAIEIDGIGIFKKTGSIRSLDEYTQVDGNESFVAVSKDNNDTILDKMFRIDTDDEELQIILVTKGISEKIKELKEEA